MTDGLRWVFEAYPFGYSLIFCENLTPESVLERLGGRRELLFPLTRVEAQEIEVRNSMDSFAIQTSTSYVSARNYLPVLSRGTRVVAVSKDINAVECVAYAVDGQILSAFEPGLPAYAAGTDPSALGRPSDSAVMTPPQVLGRLETRFGLWVPKASEGEGLPAAALSTRR